jgi:hypothetical protein
MGQISGIVFIFLMDALKSPQGSMTISLLGLIGLMVICVILSFFLRESPVHEAGKKLRRHERGPFYKQGAKTITR